MNEHEAEGKTGGECSGEVTGGDRGVVSMSQVRVLGLFESSCLTSIEGDSEEGGSDLMMGDDAARVRRGH
jgi:hypothetical protein